MKLAWNTQKNKMSDVKGKEMEQERKGRIKNDEIDLKRTNLNFDLVEDERHLYHRVKDRVDYYKEQGSRVQKNSVVMYSNIITLSKEEADRMGETRTKHYFKTCKDYFSERFGEANI
ncbi:plasmid recombination protein, partial [Staphylococcus epidermidis]|nr:plasmid recombination protein [Staphylococcus epidermidis]